MAKIIGYARVSTLDQNLDSQIKELKKAGCNKIFSEKISGAKNNRPELEKCLEVLESGDTLIVWRLDRLGRSLTHLVKTVTDLRERGIGFKSVCDGEIDTTTASGELIFNIFAALAQFERGLIQERTNAGLSAARARGKLGGRKPILASDPKVRMAKKLHTDKSMSIKDICSTLNISKATFYRYVSLV
jgi:DNA invertase Pin-like site-specific DNA recombinase